MKILDWFRNLVSSDNLLYLDLSSDETEYFIDILDHKICSSMNGSFCVARNLIEVAEKALKEGYNKKVSLNFDMRLIYSLAARIYFLARCSYKEDVDALDIINLVNFINLPFEDQYASLSIHPELQPWLSEEINNFEVKCIAVPLAIQKSLTELLGILVDQHTKSLFSKQGIYDIEINSKTGVEQRTWRVFSSRQPSEKRLKVIVEGEKHLSRYVKVLVEKMDDFYKEQGTRLSVYKFNHSHPLTDHRHVDKVVRDIVLRCTVSPEFIDVKPVYKEINVHHETSFEALPENPSVVTEDNTEAISEKEILSPEEEERLSLAKLKAIQFNVNLSRVVPDGIRYQHTYDSTSFMIALTTPLTASSSLRIYRDIQHS